MTKIKHLVLLKGLNHKCFIFIFLSKVPLGYWMKLRQFFELRDHSIFNCENISSEVKVEEFQDSYL